MFKGSTDHKRESFGRGRELGTLGDSKTLLRIGTRDSWQME